MLKTILLITPFLSFASDANNFDNLSSLFIFLILFIIMYFFLIRPQAQKIKKHKNLIEDLKKNDEIINSGGIIGKIEKISNGYVFLKVSKNDIIIIKKESIIKILPRNTIIEIK